MEEENYNTGDAALDNIRNQDGIGERELLVVSFGTSFNDSRRLTIGAIESDLEAAFPDCSVRRCFSANTVINHVERRDGIHIDNVAEALERAANNGVRTLIVQPTYLMNGFEYNRIMGEVGSRADAFEQVAFGAPLLAGDDDFERVAQAVVDWTAEYDDGETAICLMGHGTGADSNRIYRKMQEILTVGGHENYFVGTVEAEPGLKDVLARVKSRTYKKAVLEPLMVVAGDHANRDMAGDGGSSWKAAFEREGYEVICLLRGLGENEAVRKIYVEHAGKAMGNKKQDSLSAGYLLK